VGKLAMSVEKLQHLPRPLLLVHDSAAAADDDDDDDVVPLPPQ